MRTLMIAGIAAMMTIGATAAEAQRIGPPPGTNFPPPGAHPMPQPMPPQPMPAPMPRPGGWNGQQPPMQPPMPRPSPGGNGQWHGGQWHGGQWQGGGQQGGQWQWQGGPGYSGQWRGGGRWGGAVGGYWWGGAQAPGGWNGYKHLKRGKTLPRYWMSGAFLIGDYGRYGLLTPPPGYYWTRYYNDAVLIDRSGVVFDSRDGLDWDSYDGGYAQDGYVVEGYAAAPPPPANYGATYTYQSTQGYVAPGTTTTIVIPGAVTTTTTTEYVEEHYVAPRRTVRVVKRKWRPRPKPRCYCVVRGS